MMAREVSLQEVLTNTVSLVGEYTQCDSCLLYLLDGEDLASKIVAKSEQERTDYEKALAESLLPDWENAEAEGRALR